VSLTDEEKAEVNKAAPRIRKHWYGSMRPAEFGREVVLDWARHINAQPADARLGLPSTMLAELREQLAKAEARVRELEASGRTADAGARSAPGQVRAAAGGRKRGAR
jgi:hypothetical protein